VAPAQVVDDKKQTDQPRSVPSHAEPAARLRVLVEQANQGDQAALAELRRFLDVHPEIWQTCGDLGRVAERAWLDVLVGNDTLARASAQRHLGAMKAELIGPRPTSLERLLADEIAVSYLAKQHAEVSATSGGSIAQVSFRQRRLEGAARRFVRAVKTLADLRAAGGKLAADCDQAER